MSHQKSGMRLQRIHDIVQLEGWPNRGVEEGQKILQVPGKLVELHI